MKARAQVDPDQAEQDRAEIRRLHLEARRACIGYKREAGNPVGAEEHRRALAASPAWQRWAEASGRLSALVDAEVPDLAAAKRAYWWGRVGPVTDYPEDAA